MLQYAHLAVERYSPDFDRVQPPFPENPQNLLLPAFLSHQQHAFLGFAEHDLVWRHAGFALWDTVQFDFNADVPARSHLASRAGQTGSAHVLNAHHSSGLHGLEAGFEQKLFQERIAYLHIGTLAFRSLAELLAGHGRPVDAVTTGL